MDRADPAILVRALREMINLSQDDAGPDLDDVLSAAPETPVYWATAVLTAWRKFAERYNRPFCSEIAQSGPLRFIRINMLPPLQFEAGERPCRLCGFQCSPPARSWHPECYAAFEPHSSHGWKRITKIALKRCGNRCETCNADFKVLKQLTLTPWRKVYDVDHKIPLFKGGSHGLENVQILCEACHKEKTKKDLAKEGEDD